jgi:hypothetical protein
MSTKNKRFRKNILNAIKKWDGQDATAIIGDFDLTLIEMMNLHLKLCNQADEGSGFYDPDGVEEIVRTLAQGEITEKTEYVTEETHRLVAVDGRNHIIAFGGENLLDYTPDEYEIFHLSKYNEEDWGIYHIQDAIEGLTERQALFVLDEMRQQNKWGDNTTLDEIKKVFAEIIANPGNRERLAEISMHDTAGERLEQITSAAQEQKRQSRETMDALRAQGTVP